MQKAQYSSVTLKSRNQKVIFSKDGAYTFQDKLQKIL